MTVLRPGKWHTACPRTRSFLVLLFCLTTGLRLACVGATFKGNEKVVSWEDVSIAKNLLAGNGYALDNTWRTRMTYGTLIPDLDQKIKDPLIQGSRPTTLKQPAFPFLLTAVFYVFGFGNFLALFVVHSVLAGLTAVTLFLTLRSQSESAATGVALGFALFPPFIYQCATSPEATIVLLFLASLFFFQAVSLQRGPTVTGFAIFGVIAGIMVMTSPGMLIFTTLGICSVALVACASYSAAIRQVIVAGVLVSAIVSPWLIRNYVMFDRFVVRAGTGHSLLKPQAEAGHYTFPEHILLDLEKQGRGLSEVEEGEMLESAIRSEMGEDQGVLGHQALANLVDFWWEPPRYRNDYSLPYMLGRRIPYYLLLVFAIPAVTSSLIQLARRRGTYIKDHLSAWLALLLIAAETVVYSFVGGWNIRYHFPTELALLLLAAQTAVVLGDRVRSVALHKSCSAI